MDREQKQQILDFVPAILLNIPRLTFRLSTAYLRFRGQAARATRDFRTGLYKEGLPSEDAERLAGDFAEGTRFFSLSILKNLGDLGARKNE